MPGGGRGRLVLAGGGRLDAGGGGGTAPAATRVTKARTETTLNCILCFLSEDWLSEESW